VRHFEEQQISQLLDVVAIRKTIVTKDVAVVPEPLNDLLRGSQAKVSGGGWAEQVSQAGD
jgi:hypothetical protein